MDPYGFVYFSVIIMMLQKRSPSTASQLLTPISSVAVIGCRGSRDPGRDQWGPRLGVTSGGAVMSAAVCRCGQGQDPASPTSRPVTFTPLRRIIVLTCGDI